MGPDSSINFAYKDYSEALLVHGDMGALPNTYPVRGELSVAVTLRHS